MTGVPRGKARGGQSYAGPKTSGIRQRKRRRRELSRRARRGLMFETETSFAVIADAVIT